MAPAESNIICHAGQRPDQQILGQDGMKNEASQIPRESAWVYICRV